MNSVTLNTFLEAIPAAAASPMALVAYLAAVALWTAVAWRVRRFSALLPKLESIPPEHRLDAVRAETNTPALRTGLSPEQWIRSQIHFYCFVAFLVLVGALVVVFAIARVKAEELPGRVVILAQGEDGSAVLVSKTTFTLRLAESEADEGARAIQCAAVNPWGTGAQMEFRVPRPWLSKQVWLDGRPDFEDIDLPSPLQSEIRVVLRPLREVDICLQPEACRSRDSETFAQLERLSFGEDSVEKEYFQRRVAEPAAVGSSNLHSKAVDVAKDLERVADSNCSYHAIIYKHVNLALCRLFAALACSGSQRIIEAKAASDSAELVLTWIERTEARQQRLQREEYRTKLGNTIKWVRGEMRRERALHVIAVASAILAQAGEMDTDRAKLRLQRLKQSSEAARFLDKHPVAAFPELVWLEKQ